MMRRLQSFLFIFCLTLLSVCIVEVLSEDHKDIAKDVDKSNRKNKEKEVIFPSFIIQVNSLDFYCDDLSICSASAQNCLPMNF